LGDVYFVVNEDALFVWTGNEWKTITNIKGPVGERGERGERGEKGETGSEGPAGTGLIMRGEVNTPQDLPSSALKIGDTYYVISN
jgi:hypothetical protein